MKTHRYLASTLLALALPVASHAALIDSTTLGTYNATLGDLAATDGPGGFFLGPNVSEGDSTINSAAEPAGIFQTVFVDGAADFSGPQLIPATWAVNTETAIVYTFDLAALSGIHIDLGVDNGVLVWLDGIYKFGARAGGSSFPDEYDIDLANVSAGTHFLQVIRADHGGGTGFDINATVVPEPATLSLLGLGLFAIGLIRHRKSTRLS